MIIQNGKIEFKAKTAGGIDSTTGFPIASTSISWDNGVACQYIINSRDNLGIVKGEHFVKAEYTILIEQGASITSEQIRLKDLEGNILGEFSIISVEQLDAVCQVKILV